jgi:hypothetical protein
MKNRKLLKASLLLLVSFSLTTCMDPLKPGLGDKVDIEAPSVTIDSHRDGQYLSGVVAFEGSFSDDIAANSITISTDGGSSFSPVSRIDNANGVWAHDVNTALFGDNEYEVRVRATDGSGKTMDAKVLVFFDNTAPVVLLNSPQGAVPNDPATGPSYNQIISIAGDAYDPLGITRVDLRLFDGDPALPGTSELVLRRTQADHDQAVADGETPGDRADGSSAWSYPLDTTIYTTGSVDDYWITVTARDRAGNRAESFFYADTLRDALSPTPVPSVDDLYQAYVTTGTLAASSLDDLTEPTLGLLVDQDLDLPQFEFSVPSLTEPGLGDNPKATGAVSDDDGVDPASIEILIDIDESSAIESDWVEVDTVSGSGGRVNWEHDLSALAQAPHFLYIRAVDIKGRPAVSDRLDFAIDYGIPQLTIDSPAPGSYHNGDITLSGTAEDGSAIDSVRVSDDGGLTWSDATLTPGAPVGPPDTRTWSYTASAASLTEGAVTFRVQALDAALKTYTESIQVTLDLTDPGLVFLAPSDGDLVNGTLLLQGTGDDRSPFDELQLYDVDYASVGSATPIATINSGTNTFDPDSGGTPSSYYRWYKAVDTTAYQLLGDAPEARTFTIVASDGSGNVGHQEVSVTIDQATDIPEIVIDTLSLVAGQNVYNTSSSLVGTMSDDDAIDASTAQYSLVSSGAAESWQPVTFSTGGDAVSKRWSIALPPTGGTYDLDLRVFDVNGRESALAVDDVLLDSGPPTLTEADSGATSTAPIYRNADVNLGGEASDSSGIDTVTVEYTKDGTTTGSLTPTITGNQWDATLPVSLGDGAYEVTIIATDGAGATATLVRNVVLDTSPVELEVTDPINGALVETTDYTIRGRVTDSAGQGVQSLEGSFTGVDPDWFDIPITGLNWSKQLNPVNPEENLGGQGAKTLYVRADDGLNPPTLVTVTFSYDTEFPLLTETGIGTATQQIANDGFSLTGEVSDSNALGSFVIASTKDGASQGTLLNDTATPYSYAVTLPGDGSDDGLWVYTLTATDEAGRQTALTRSVLIDESAPTAPSIDPFVGDYVVDELVTSGNASDGGSGVDLVEYSFDYTDDGNDANDTWTSVTGTTNWYRTIDISAGGANLAEGTHTFYARATDNAGNVSAVASQTFVVDRNAPTLEITGGNTAETPVYRNSDITLSGTAGDQNGDPSITVTYEKDGGPAVTILNGSVIDWAAGVTLDLDAGPDNIAGNLDDGFIGNGEYLFTVTAEDAVGKVKALERTVHIDRTPPGSATMSLSAGDLVGTSEYTITGTYADDGGSGVALVEYSTDYGSGDPGSATWNTATGSASWSVSLSGLNDSLGQPFAVRATDNAGNVSGVEERTFIVDTAPPTLAITGGNTAPSLVYRNGDITLSGTSTDENGEPSITVTYSKDGGSAVNILTGNATDWAGGVTLDLDAGPDNIAGNGDDAFIGDGEYLFTVTAEDAVGKTTGLTRTVRIDSNLPTAEITSVSPVLDGDTVNGIATVRALISDDIGIASTEWALLTDGDSPVGNYTAVPGSQTTPQFEIDTTQASGNVLVNGSGPFTGAIVDESLSVLWIRATDRAGNSYTVSQNLFVSQASDNPTIEFTTIDDTVTAPADSFKNLIESNGLLRFSISDDDLVDASSIEISIGDAASWQTINYNGGATPSDARSVTTSHDLYTPTMLTEGTTSFYLRVSDEGSAKSGIPVTETEVGPIYLMVDRNFPAVTETTLAGDVFRSALFTLGGTVSDTNALKSILVTESKDGGSAATALSQSLSGNSESWNLSGMPTSGSPDDGEYLYTITVTDGSDKETVLTRTVTIDTTGPLAPVVTNPAADSWLNSSTFVFSGTASDGSGSGVSKVYYSEAARGTGAPAPGDPAWEQGTVDGSGNWSASVSIAAAGERELHLYSEDAAGNIGPVTTRNFGLDQTSPSVTLSGGPSATQYVNGDFTIDGGFTDASGIASITVAESTDNATFNPTTPAPTFDNGAGSWSWNRTLGGQTDGVYYYRFSFTDNAGNSSEITKTVNLDRLAPTVSFDTASPSINFDGGAASATGNGTMSLSGSVVENQGTGNLQSLDYQVDGGGYVSLPVNGSFTIAGIDTTVYPDASPLPVDLRAIDKNGNERIEQFTLNVEQSTDLPVVSITSPGPGATISNTSVTIIGRVTDDDGVTGDPGTVQYRYSPTGNSVDFGSWQDVLVTGTPTSQDFSYPITSASDGAKLLQMRGVDENGITSDVLEISFSFDTDEPEINGLAPSEGSYFNGDFAVSGTVTDDTDVNRLEYRVERNGTQVIPATLGDWVPISGTPSTSINFNETIDTSFGGGTYEIFIEAGDGTFTRAKSVSVFVDKTDPTASFAFPGGGSTQNNVITLNGGTSDNYGIQSVDFVVVDTLNNTHPLPTGTVSGTNSWSITGFDTRDATLLSYADNLGGGLYEVTLRAIITDIAGNLSSAAAPENNLLFRIDQAEDRPVVTLDTIATDGSSTIQTTTVTGTATDDDGVSSLIVETWNVGNATATPDQTESVTLTSGSYGDTSVDWRVTLANGGNGLRGIRVRAIDSVDNNGSDYSATDYSRSDTGRIDFQLDTEIPDVAIASPAANITWSSNNSFDVTGTSGDETGITALAWKADDNDFSTGSTPVSAPYDNWSFTIAQGDLADGPHTIYVEATDSVGNTRVTSRQISVDKTAPTISVTSPANGTDVYGPLTIGGTAADNAGGAGVASIAVGLGKQIDEGNLAGSTWTAVPGTTSWSFSFANINDYANTTYSYNTGDLDQDGIEDAGESWTDLWDFTFYVRAIDGAGEGAGGNAAYLTSYTLTIDPKRDRPEVSILSPEDGATVGGFVRVFGSSFDAQFVEKVQIAIDTNNNGDYSDDSWSEGTLDETDADGVNWYLAEGTTSWNVRLNEASEFDPTGADTTRTITFKVRAWDYKTTPGDGIPGGEVEYSITFNKSFPRFESMSLTSGATVGGTVTLTGLVRDESDIQRIIFSNEGPLLDNTVVFDNPGGLTPPGAATTVVDTTPNPYGGPDVTVELLGTSDPEYDAAFPGSYRINVPIDTEAPGLYFDGAGSMSVKVTAEDTTTPSPFTNQNLISFNVDNVDPSSLAYTGDTEIIGTQAELMGTVQDTGTVSGIERLVVYMTNAAGEILRLQGAGGTITGFSVADVLDESNATYDNYRMVIDNRLEEGNDGGAAGDGDGIAEFLTISAGVYNWSGLFDSSLVADGAVTVHYVAEDFAGNRATGSTAAFVANNKPVIDSIVLGTDLDDTGTVEVDEQTPPVTDGYGATNYTARNDRLYLGINASGGNGTLRYSVFYEGLERNGILTNNTLELDTSGLADTAANGASFTIKVYDSTTSDDVDQTDELSDEITLNLTIDNIDELPPSIEVAPFGQRYNESPDDAAKALESVAGYEENIATGGSVRLGHVEYAADSTHDGPDADISGRVIFKGKAEDNQNISRITATISNYNGGAPFDIYDVSNGGAQSTADWSFTIDGAEYLTDANGNVFNWNFEWNSATLADTVATNLTVTFIIYDANGSPNSATNGITVDVVPYITKIVRPDGESATYRSRLGKYSVRQGEGTVANPLEIHGFNLSTAGSAWIRLFNSDRSQVDEITTANFTANGSSTVLSIADSSALQHSGWLSVGVNGVESINNSNANSREWHKEDDGSGLASTLWTDDRYLQVWNYEGAFDGSFSPVHPAMDANRSSWQLWASWSYYATSSMFTASLGPSNPRSEIFSTYDPPEWTDIHVEDNVGNERRIAYLQNYYNGGNTWGWIVTHEDVANSTAFIERLGDDNAGAPNYGDGQDEQLYQFQNPRIAYDPVNDRNYVSYYDAYSRTLKYAITDGTTETFTTSNGNLTSGNTVVDGLEDTGAPPTSTGDDVGLWSSIQLDTSGGADATAPIPVIMYYDSTNSTLKIARGNNSAPGNSTEWTVAEVFRADDPYRGTAGYYVDMKLDASGNVHAVAYRVSTGDLLYITATNVDGGGGGYTFSYSEIVDSEGAVGSWADLDLVGSTPYISYLSGNGIGTFAGLKMAYFDTVAGAWEHSVVATDSIVESMRTSIIARPSSGAWVTSTKGKVAIGYGGGTYNLVILEDEE